MTCCSTNDNGLAIEWSVAPINAAYIVAITGIGTSRVITAQVSAAGFYLFRLTLVDLATTPGTKTLTPPSGSDITEWWLTTDSMGLLTKTIVHDGLAQTWYPVLGLICRLSIGDALAFT